MDRGAWWAAVCRVTKSQTRLKRLSTSVCMHVCVCAVKPAGRKVRQNHFMATSQVDIQGNKGPGRTGEACRNDPSLPHVPPRTLLLTPSLTCRPWIKRHLCSEPRPSTPLRTVNPLLVYHTHSLTSSLPGTCHLLTTFPLILLPFFFPKKVSPKMAPCLICSVLNLRLRTAPSTE